MHGESNRTPPLPRFVGEPMSWLYRAVVACRNRRFDAGRGVVELDRPVVSVGNLSLGGTGKTPMVAHLLRTLRAAGRWPCVAMRGYGSADPREADEAREYLAEFPDLPLVARANRLDGLVDLFATEDGDRVDCVILDDGFQHRRIARVLDIVLIDATRSPFEDRLFPAGWLREPPGSLARADAVVLTHADAAGEEACEMIERRVREAAARALVVRARHEWASLAVNVPGAGAWETRREPVEFARGRRVFAVCAIGNPEVFLGRCRGAGELVGSMALRDHDPYAPSTIARVIEAAGRARAELILTTRKDWMKLERAAGVRWPGPVCVPALALRLGCEGALENAVLEACGGKASSLKE